MWLHSPWHIIYQTECASNTSLSPPPFSQPSVVRLVGNATNPIKNCLRLWIPVIPYIFFFRHKFVFEKKAPIYRRQIHLTGHSIQSFFCIQYVRTNIEWKKIRCHLHLVGYLMEWKLNAQLIWYCYDYDDRNRICNSRSVRFYFVVVVVAAAAAFKMPLGVLRIKRANVIQRNKKWKLKISGRARIPILIFCF